MIDDSRIFSAILASGVTSAPICKKGHIKTGRNLINGLDGRKICRECFLSGLNKRGKKEDLEKFLDRVSPEPNTGCWLWIGRSSSYGYGYFPLGKRQKREVATHTSLRLFKGIILPSGKFACHKCDVPCCVNPDHLFIGTAKENTYDALKKGRLIGNSRKSFKKLLPSAVIVIRDRRLSKYEVAERFQISLSNVRKIREGKTWRNIK